MMGLDRRIEAGLVSLVLGLALLGGVIGRAPEAWAQAVIPLTSGVPVNGSVDQGFFADFSIVVPAGVAQLTVTLTNLSGDVDLFVKFGVLPETDLFDCVSEQFNETNEICTFTNPQAGTWFISALGFESGTHSFTVTATFQSDPSSAFVTRLYQQVLNRAPEPGGVDLWVQKIQQDGSVVPTVLAFFHSVEFLNRNTTNGQFLTILYHTFLDRDPDPAGFNAFLAALNAGALTRDNLLDIFMDSDEFRDLASFLPPLDPVTDFVSNLYVRILGRGPDPGGLQAFVAQLQQSCNSSSVVSLIEDFLESPEFLARNTSNAEYVTLLYRVFLGRIPDPNGLATFVQLLNQGSVTRNQLLTQFAASSEFQGILQDLCSGGPPPGGPFPVSVSISGTGTGTVSSSPGGISCSTGNAGTCSANFTSGASVTLTANATSGTFGGWGGACAAFGTAASCTLSVTAAKSVSATFNAAGPPPGGISGTYSTTGTASANNCGIALDIPVQPAFNLTITQTGSTFTGSGTANVIFQNTPIQAQINLTNGTVSATNQLSGTLALTINALGQSIPVTGTFTGSVSGNTLTLNGSGTLPANLGAPPGCGFNITLTGTR